MHPTLLLPLLLAACTDDGQQPDDKACPITVESTVPAADATDAYYRAPIEFQLSDPDPTALVTSDIPGATSFSEDGQTVLYTPDAPLAPGTAYSATLAYCGGTQTLAFTTSSEGTPLADPTILLGRTYSFELGDARIVQPAAMQAVFGNFPSQAILLGVSAVTATTVQVTEAASVQGSDPLVQDYCATTTDLPTGDFTEQPYFALSTPTATVSVAGIPVDVTDLAISGAFAADGSYIAGGTLSGLLDTRPLAPLSGGTDPATVCNLAVNLGVVCEPCPTDGSPYCLTLIADQITAPELSGVSIVGIDASNCDGCADGPPADDAVCDP